MDILHATIGCVSAYSVYVALLNCALTAFSASASFTSEHNHGSLHSQREQEENLWLVAESGAAAESSMVSFQVNRSNCAPSTQFIVVKCVSHSVFFDVIMVISSWMFSPRLLCLGCSKIVVECFAFGLSLPCRCHNNHLSEALQ